MGESHQIQFSQAFQQTPQAPQDQTMSEANDETNRPVAPSDILLLPLPAPHRPLCIPSDVTQLCSLISRRRLCHSREGGGRGRGCRGMTRRQAASRRLKECAPGSAPQLSLGRVPKQGHFPVSRRWTPRPEMPRLEMKNNPTE